MNLLNKTVKVVEDFLEITGRFLTAKDFTEYCELATNIGLTDDDLKHNYDDSYILVNKNNSLLSVFELQGTSQILSETDFDEIIDNLRVKMNGYMRRYGHSLTFSFERDPDRSIDELLRLAEPQLIAARRIGLKSEDIILDRVARNAPLTAFEQNLLVVYTHTSVMDPEELKRELKDRLKDVKTHKLPNIKYGQTPAQILLSMKYRHDTMIEQIKRDFENCGTGGKAGIMLRSLGCHEAVKRVRIMVNRERTSQKFKPVLFGDKFLPHGKEDNDDYSDLVPPKICYQVCANDINTEGELIHTDELCHGVLTLELGPQEPQYFSNLFMSLDKTIPWRIRFDIAPNGLNELRGRQMMASFVGMLPSNKQIRQSFIDLVEKNKDDAVCLLKVGISTWSESKRETLRRLASIEKAVQSWGICQLTQVHGDPLAAWASTIPAFTSKSIANKLVPPLSDALSMLPLQRPATPWGDYGSLVVRTPCGKIYPIQLGSRLQDTWIELISAPPGSGKSVLLNTMNNSVIHKAGNNKLPLMTIVDVGPSSSGLIQLIRDSLPEDRQNEALYLKLYNNKDYAVNPFDTQLGARFPTTHELSFLIDFLTLFCVDAYTGKAEQACAKINEMILKLAYEDKAKKSANSYEMDIDQKIDQALDKTGLKNKYDENWWLAASWWEVTDMLFSEGLIKEAALAQRYAVPVLSDFSAYLQHESVRQLYSEVKTSNGEPILNFMLRSFTAAIQKYELFSGVTRFELSSNTRVISLDLNSVIGSKTPEGKLQTAIMYMFARQLSAKNYFLDETQILQVVSSTYFDYHKSRVSDIQDEQKVIAYDEVHNASSIDSFIQAVTKDGREGRKWGIRIIGASQFLHDYPDDLLDAATSIFVMRGGSSADEKILKDKFNVSNEAIRRLQREAIGPGPEGGNFLAIFKTKVGTICQMLTNTTGPIELWAFSTTQEDVALRNRLYKSIGPSNARRILAKRFPTGSATKYIESKKNEIQESEENISVIEMIAKELINEFNLQTVV